VIDTLTNLHTTGTWWPFFIYLFRNTFKSVRYYGCHVWDITTRCLL